MAGLFKMTADAFEAVGVTVLIFGFVLSMGHFIKRIFRVTERNEAFRELREGFGQTLLLALDLLVAADVILTITIDLSFETLGMLGLLVLIRTFLHFVLELEVSGRWPWQGTPRAEGE
ncbi:MAG: DUF1622 domain-containing protein [Gammaproteobacteria bacterium]